MDWSAVDEARGESVTAKSPDRVLFYGKETFKISLLSPKKRGILANDEIETEGSTYDIYFLRIASRELVELIAPNTVVIVVNWLEAGPSWSEWIEKCLETISTLESNPRLILYAQNFETVASDPNFMIEDANDALEQYLRAVCYKSHATLIYEYPEINWSVILDRRYAPEACFKNNLLIPAGQDSPEKILAVNSSFPLDDVGHGYIPKSLPGIIPGQSNRTSEAEVKLLKLEDITSRFHEGAHKVDLFANQEPPEAAAVRSFFDYLKDKAG